MTAERISILRRFGPFSFGLVFLILACSLVGTEKNDQKFSFNKSYDTLAQFDSVVITLKDTTGRTIDNLYRGKADTIREIENLPSPHWNGSGIVVVSIVGYDSGKVVYHVDKRYDGATSRVLDTLRIILPGTLLSASAADLTFTEGDSVPLPKVTVTPAELSDKSLTYVSSAPALLFVGDGYLRALQRGSAKLDITLKSNPSKTLSIPVTILPNPLTPDAVTVLPDTLRIAAGGAPGSLSAQVSPSTADAAVSWSLRDTTIARFTGAGIVQGLKAGQTVALATSLRKPGLSDSSLILVQAPVAVSSVRFLMDSLDLFVGGAAESLTVAVLPALANPKVDITIAHPALVGLLGGRVQGLAEGKTRVIARSAENPAVSDTLEITVLPSQKIDSVRVSPDSVVVFTGGAAASLAGKVYPAASSQTLLWRMRNEAVAAMGTAGSVSARAPGRTQAIGYSRVDSTKKDSALVIAKRDTPRLNVGRDTVLAVGSTLVVKPTVSQEYGSIVRFTWDGNGDGTFEGASDTLKAVSLAFPEAKETLVAFNVKDSEGNDTTVYKKVKAVAGPAVQIVSPLDSSYTRLFTVDVMWTVNGKEQDSLKKQALKLGANAITRSARDEAGNLYSDAITVFVDTTPPNKPIVRGLLSTASKTPTWTWATGGGGGSGTFKYWVDVDDSSKGKEIRDTTFTPATELGEGLHTLFVSERDAAGNWSAAGRFATRIDLSAPVKPKVSVTPASPTNQRKPKWSWATGGGGGIGIYRYKLDNNVLTTGATQGSDTSYTPTANLSHGTHILYVQEKDSADNWSESGSAPIVIDTLAPAAPAVTATQTSPTNESRPTWTWTGGGGGRGFFRYKVGDTVWASGAQGSVTEFRPAAALAEGARTLYVSEQDSAGNWSAPGSFGLTLDLTSPGMPQMDSTPPTPLNTLKPTWTWKSGGGGNGTYRVRVDNPDVTGGTTVSSASYPQPANLSEGRHTIYVQERDAAGNWSATASRSLVLALRGVVGGASAYSDASQYVSLAFHPNGTPYLGFSADGHEGKAAVVKFNGSNWESVGSQVFSANYAYGMSLKISKTGIPYVAYSDAANGQRSTVMSYNGSSWSPVGTVGFSAGSATGNTLAISPTGVVHIAFSLYDKGGRAGVMRFNGTKWDTLGIGGFTSGSTNDLSLAINSSGVPYLAYHDEGTDLKASVARFNGVTWEKVGTNDISSWWGLSTSLAFDSEDIPYVAFSDRALGSKTTVKRLVGQTWQSVGTPGFSEGAAHSVHLAISPQGTPFVCYVDESFGDKLTVMKFDGTNWVPVGPKILSVGTTGTEKTFAVSPDGVPFVGYLDADGGYKPFVVKTSFDP